MKTMNQPKKLGFAGLFLFFFIGTLSLLGGEKDHEGESGLIFSAYVKVDEGFKAIAGDRRSGILPDSEMYRGIFSGMAERLHAVKGEETEKKRLDQKLLKEFFHSLQDLATNGRFQPESLSIMVKSEKEFVALIRGAFSTAFFRNFFARETSMQRPDGFAIAGQFPQGGSDQIVVHFSDSSIFLCPADYEGNVMDSLHADHSGLSGFSRGLRERLKNPPVFAMEANVGALSGWVKEEAGEFSDLLRAISRMQCLISPEANFLALIPADSTGRDSLFSFSQSLLRDFQGTRELSAGTGTPSEQPWKAMETILNSLQAAHSEEGVVISGSGLKGSSRMVEVGFLGALASFGLSNYERAREISQ